MTPHLGQRAVYLPRVPYGRQSELFAFVTRIVDAERGVVDLVAFPAGSEALHLNAIMAQSEAVRIHCWKPVADHAGSASDPMPQIEMAVTAAVAPLSAMIKALADRLDVLEEIANSAPAPVDVDGLLASVVARLDAIEAKLAGAPARRNAKTAEEA